MTDKTEAMDNLIAQDADLIEICPDDLVRRLRSNRPIPTIPHEAADLIEAQSAEIEHLRAEAEAHYDRGYYDGSTHLLQQIQSAMADEIKQLRKEQEQSK